MKIILSGILTITISFSSKSNASPQTTFFKAFRPYLLDSLRHTHSGPHKLPKMSTKQKSLILLSTTAYGFLSYQMLLYILPSKSEQEPSEKKPTTELSQKDWETIHLVGRGN